MISNYRRNKHFSVNFLNLGKGREETEYLLNTYLLCVKHVLGKMYTYKTSFLPRYNLVGVGIIIPL